MQPTIYHKTIHQIDKRLIDEPALWTIQKLQEAHHTSYIVGGSVRDLLLGGRPKDFDISTSAHPEEIKKIFGRQCLLIGRRFRLAHIRHEHHILEVATFRSGDIDDSSLITRDNDYGSLEEDVLRRDFTVNALFYDPHSETILDYVGGFDDVKKNLLKTIGDPEIRFRQDPVRMLRLLKFQARFGFRIDEETLRAMKKCRRDIVKSAPARLMEELFKMLESSKSEPFFHLLTEHGFTKLLLPCFHHFFSEPSKEKAFSYLRTIDEIHTIQTRQKVDRAVLLASLIFPIIDDEITHLMHDRQSPPSFSEITHLIERLFHAIQISSHVHFPRKLFGSAHQVVLNQFRMTPLHKPLRYETAFTSEENFLLALTLLRIRATIDPSLGTICDIWESKRQH